MRPFEPTLTPWHGQNGGEKIRKYNHHHGIVVKPETALTARRRGG